MILQGLIIVLVILIVANFAVGFFNKVSPPCLDADEYFQGATKLPDGAIAGLGSIPTNTSFDYVGAARVPGPNGSIALTSYNGYIGKVEDHTEKMCNPSLAELDKEDASDCAERVSKEAMQSINTILNPGNKPDKVVAVDKRLAVSEFDVGMSEFNSRLTHKKSERPQAMALAHRTARDGYTSRPGDKDN